MNHLANALNELAKKTPENMKRVKICPKCGSVLMFSFCLPYKEYVCVPCGKGVEFFNDCSEKFISKAEYADLREKYDADLDFIGLQTCKKGGGSCKYCNKEFNCEHCKKTEQHKLQYWGKGL